MNSDETRPVNIGNPDEFTILEFAEAVREVVEKVQKENGDFKKRVEIVHREIPTDDPMRRRPDTTRAKQELKWQPNFTVLAGVEEMVRYYDVSLLDSPALLLQRGTRRLTLFSSRSSSQAKLKAGNIA
jgi:UDP-glucuronate decarboxylase